MNQLLNLLAQTTRAASQAASSSSTTPKPWWVDIFSSPLAIVIPIFVLLMVFQLKAKKAQERKRLDTLNLVKRGDRVQTIGGILGTVVDAREDEVVVKVDETSNTKIRFTRSAIHKVLDAEKTEAK